MRGGMMELKKIFTFKKTVFLVIFTLAALATARINFSLVIGANNQYFTLFQFFGPVAGAFLGNIFGIISVLASQIINYLLLGKAFDLVNVLRLLPMLFAVYYFASFPKKKKLGKIIMIIVPLIAILLFVTHPIAREAWYFSLYWLIPILAVILPKKAPGKLFFRSFGATFTAHAIGTIAWLYTIPMTASQWTALIPVVAYERFLFGAGIAVSFVVLNTALDKICEKTKIPAEVLHVERDYVFSKKFFRLSA